MGDVSPLGLEKDRRLSGLPLKLKSFGKVEELSQCP